MSPTPTLAEVPTENAPAALRFSIQEGRNENYFFRRGLVAAHLITTSGHSPRILVAFPAGNTGVGLWFKNAPDGTRLGLAPGSALDGVERPDGMRGVTAHLQSDARSLTITSTMLANIRSIRDYIYYGLQKFPPELACPIDPGPPLVLSRTTVDGKHHVELRLVGENGTVVTSGPDGFRLEAGPTGHIELRLSALTDETALTPFAPEDLFTSAVANRPLDRQVFAFLASEEKFTAGSWRFLTYFGRDTLLSLQLLMPVLQPAVIESALGSVIERLGPHGEVAHEEGIGEFAALQHLHEASPPADLSTPVLDYRMIDGDFLLAPAVAAYLLDTPGGGPRAARFLARLTSRGESYAVLLRRNLDLVLALSAPFAAKPQVENLMRLKAGLPMGNWRDSSNGLGGGCYPFDVNAALVPAALNATARLYASGLLGAESGRATQAKQFAVAWRAAERYFAAAVPEDVARRQIAAYAAHVHLDATAALASLAGPLSFHCLALDAAGRPIPVMHTDGSFLLFFLNPSVEDLDSVAQQIIRPFPAGLRTTVGLVVANPALADAATQAIFTTADYHGTVVWSWQQALMAAGLRRQLARSDLPANTRTRLIAAQRELWKVITAFRTRSAGELWTWAAQDGQTTWASFGQTKGHVDESNAAQLWSTVYLAVQPPPDHAPGATP